MKLCLFLMNIKMSWTYIAPTLILGIRVTGSGGLDNHDVRMALKKVHGSHNKSIHK